MTHVELVGTAVKLDDILCVLIIFTDFINEPIVLINNTPDVELEIGGTTASVEVDFTVRNDVASVTCELSDLIGPMDCEFLYTPTKFNIIFIIMLFLVSIFLQGPHTHTC